MPHPAHLPSRDPSVAILAGAGPVDRRASRVADNRVTSLTALGSPQSPSNSLSSKPVLVSATPPPS